MQHRIPLTLIFLISFIHEISSQRIIPVIGNNPIWPLEHQGIFYDATVYDNKLYAVGSTNSNATDPYNNIIVWDGNELSHFPELTTQNSIRTITTFNDQIVVGVRNTNLDEVYSFDGTAWSIMGSDLEGRIDGLVVHNGELFACGDMAEPAMRWNGSSWVGTGSENFSYCPDMISYNQELYAILNDSIIGKWDGNSWLTIAHGFDDFRAYSFLPHQNALYITGNVLMSEEIQGVCMLENDSLSLSDLQIDHRVFTGGFFNEKFYNTDGNALYENNTLLFDIGMSTTNLQRPADFITYDGGLYLFLSSTINDPFIVDSGQNIYRLDYGQTFASIRPENHQIRALFDANSDFFAMDVPRNNSNAGFYYPADSLTTAIFGAQLTASATDQGDTLAAFPQYTNLQSAAWFAGPVSDQVDQEYLKRYLRVWKVTQAEISEHILHAGDPGYPIPESIASWPGNGRYDKGEAHTLAPFVDVNGDNWYNPELGDYPDIRGTEAVFLMLNDHFAVHSSSYFYDPSNPRRLELEAHIMFYAYENQLPPLDKTIFMHSVIYNRSNFSYEDLRLGMFNDLDIGNGTNDFSGSNEALDYVFAYDATNDDPDFEASVQGYGINPPASACIFLGQEMASAVTILGGSSGNVNGPANSAKAGYYRMLGLNNSGAPVAFNNVNMDTFSFSDSPCSTGLENEVTVGLLQGDRIMQGSTGPMTLLSGGYTCFDAAFTVTSQDQNNIDNACELEEIVPLIRDYYTQNIGQSCSVLNKVIGAKHDFGMEIFPNPAHNVLYIKLGTQLSAPSAITVYDIAGTQVKRVKTDVGVQQVELDITSFASGTYIARFNGYACKFIVQH